MTVAGCAAATGLPRGTVVQLRDRLVGVRAAGRAGAAVHHRGAAPRRRAVAGAGAGDVRGRQRVGRDPERLPVRPDGAADAADRRAGCFRGGDGGGRVRRRRCRCSWRARSWRARPAGMFTSPQQAAVADIIGSKARGGTAVATFQMMSDFGVDRRARSRSGRSPSTSRSARRS